MGRSGIGASVIGALLLASCGSAEKAPAPKPTIAKPEADPVSLSFLPAEFHASGTEPFWSAAVSKGQLTYVTPETQKTGGVTVPVTRADGAENALFVATIDGQTLQLQVTPGPCSDGMSDKTYPWTVDRTLGEASVDGCAEPPLADSAPKIP